MGRDDDMEKNRSENVASLETRLQHALSEAKKYKELADKWAPVCHAEVGTEDVRFTLSFGGKRSTASITFDSMARTDVVTATSAIVDVLIESNAAARLREAVQPEVERVQASLKAVGKAGKW